MSKKTVRETLTSYIKENMLYEGLTYVLDFLPKCKEGY